MCLFTAFRVSLPKGRALCVLDIFGSTKGRWVQSDERRGPCPRSHSNLRGSLLAPIVGEETEVQRG